MEGLITVDLPDEDEERRLLAEAVANIHNTLLLVLEDASRLLPGESIDEVKAAWPDFSRAMDKLVRRLNELKNVSSDDPGLTDEKRKDAQLSGAPLQAKLGGLRRLWDGVKRCWHDVVAGVTGAASKLRDSLGDYLEFASTVVGSLGAELVVEAIDLFRMLIGEREKRLKQSES